MNYEDFLFKVPVESSDYRENSDFVIQQIESIIKEAIDSQRNKIFINTNLRLGLPMENINKIAGPFVEAWAFEVFYEEFQKQQSEYDLVNVETMTRLNMADVVLQFKKRSTAVVANVDVKATSKDIEKSGKAPNITSYSRIRTAYVKDPDFMFVILSLKHKVYSDRNIATGLMDGVMEVVDFNAYDLKYISALDISYNPALGTGQIQIKDRILDLREKIEKQKNTLQKEIELKNKRMQEILNFKSSTNEILAINGFLAFVMTIDAVIKGYTINQFRESLKAEKILDEKGDLIENLYKQVNERVEIIAKAEKHDLQDFLKENDIYSIFEDGKLEKFLEKNESSLNSKEKSKIKINSMETSHEQ